jgi:hypothetical protein
MSREISDAAQDARERLSEEIERVRLGVEQMLDESPGAVGVDPSGQSDKALRKELEELRLETRDYVKRKLRKSEKKLEKSVLEVSARTDALERRVDQVEADRERAEVRIHSNTEQMLDGLLSEVREIADRLEKTPAPQPRKAPPPAAAPAPAAPARSVGPSPQVPVGRIGPRVARRPTR